MEKHRFSGNVSICHPSRHLDYRMMSSRLDQIYLRPPRQKEYGDEPFVALLETSTFGSPGGGKESVYRLYLVTTVYYFAGI